MFYFNQQCFASQYPIQSVSALTLVVCIMCLKLRWFLYAPSIVNLTKVYSAFSNTIKSVNTASWGAFLTMIVLVALQPYYLANWLSLVIAVCLWKIQSELNDLEQEDRGGLLSDWSSIVYDALDNNIENHQFVTKDDITALLYTISVISCAVMVLISIAPYAWSPLALSSVYLLYQYFKL